MPRKKKYPKLPNGKGSISVLSGKRRKKFLARKPAVLLPDGTTYRQIVGTYESYAQALLALESPNSKVDDKSSAYDLFNAWIKSNSFKSLAKVTQNKYIWGIKKFAPLIYLPISETNFQMWQDKLDQIENEGYIVENNSGIEERFYSKSSVSKMKNAVIKTFQQAMKNGIVSTNIGEMLEYIAIDGDNASDPFSLEQLSMIENLAQKYKFAKIIYVNIYFGLRPQEMCNLKKEHVFFNKGYIQGMGIKTSAGRNRKIPIHPKIESHLKDLYYSTDDYIVGKFMTYNEYRKEIFLPILDKLNVKEGYTPYACRKTFAFLMNRYNVDKESIKQVMGHLNYGTTSDNYIKEDIIKTINEFKKIA